MQLSVPDVRKVAVVGAGIAGIVAAKYLSDAQFSVTIFERASSIGGIWVYDGRVPPDPPYPNVVPSTAEEYPPGQRARRSGVTEELDIAALELQHAPPGPAYISLKNNIPTCLMSFKNQGWPDGTPDYTDHPAVLDYVRSFARIYDLERLIKFNTRVSSVAKQDVGWSVDTCALSLEPNQVQHKTESHHFDAVVICSGHHSAPKVPDIAGLAELKRAWPLNITHSKSYRRPQDILGQNIVIVGNGASGFDIANELKDRVSKLYQVTNNSGYIPVQFMPAIVERVAEIASVESTTHSDRTSGPDHTSMDEVTMRVHLVDGKVLDDIHSIVLCTGYLRTYPFMTQYHNDHACADAADDIALITDGSMVHNLHKDIFYIPQPTLSFIGAATGSTSLALFEYQAIAIASVLSGRAHLPSEIQMRTEYRARIDKKGSGRWFHNLRGEEVQYVDDIVAWVNGSRQENQIEGYSESWKALYEKQQAWLREIFKKRDDNDVLKPSGADVPGICNPNSAGYL